jgi:hypothetical protein
VPIYIIILGSVYKSCIFSQCNFLLPTLNSYLLEKMQNIRQTHSFDFQTNVTFMKFQHAVVLALTEANRL